MKSESCEYKKEARVAQKHVQADGKQRMDKVLEEMTKPPNTTSCACYQHAKQTQGLRNTMAHNLVDLAKDQKT